MKLLLILLILSVSAVLAQNTVDKRPICSEQDVKNISSRGIQLGTTQKNVLALFSGDGMFSVSHAEYMPTESRTKYTVVREDTQVIQNRLAFLAGRSYGFSFVSLVPVDKQKFENVARYDLGFLDEKLALLRIHYFKPKWESQEQLIRKLSETFGLPIREAYVNNDPYRIECGEHYVEFGRHNNEESSFSVTVSLNIDKITRERRKRAEDEQREKDIKAFKP